MSVQYSYLRTGFTRKKNSHAFSLSHASIFFLKEKTSLNTQRGIDKVGMMGAKDGWNWPTCSRPRKDDKTGRSKTYLFKKKKNPFPLSRFTLREEGFEGNYTVYSLLLR